MTGGATGYDGESEDSSGTTGSVVTGSRYGTVLDVRSTPETTTITVTISRVRHE